jgi:hypothetical protein
VQQASSAIIEFLLELPSCYSSAIVLYCGVKSLHPSFASSETSKEHPSISTTQPRHRFPLIFWIAVIAVIETALCASVVQFRPNKITVYFQFYFFGIFYAQLAAPAAWCALGPGNCLVRIVGSVAWAVAATLVVSAATFFGETFIRLGMKSIYDGLIPCALWWLTCYLVLLFIPLILKRRLHRPSEEIASASAGPAQFRLIHLFFAMLLASLFFGVLRFASALPTAGQRLLNPYFVITLLSHSICTLVIVLALFQATWRLPLLAALLVAGAVSVADSFATKTIFLNATLVGQLIDALIMNFSLITGLLPFGFVMRSFGYRLAK